MKKIREFSVFAIIYTILFITFLWTASYTFPFIIAFIIALSLQPLVKLLKGRLGVSDGITSLIASVLVYALFFSILILISYKMVSEARQMLSTLTTLNIEDITQLVKNWIARFDVYLKYIDPDFLNKNSSQIADIVKNSLGVIGRALNKFLSAAGFIPLWIAVMFIIIISTYFFTRDMDEIKRKLFEMFSENGQQRVLSVWEEGIRLFVRIVKSYAIIYTITFIETIIGFSLILKIKYAVILSILAAVFDIIPVLGVGAVYWPLVVIYAIFGNYKTAVGIMVLYAIVVTVRYIIEPKLVSTSLEIHPVLLLAAIFAGFMTFGASGVIHLIFLIISYKIFKKTKPDKHSSTQTQEDAHI